MNLFTFAEVVFKLVDFKTYDELFLDFYHKHHYLLMLMPNIFQHLKPAYPVSLHQLYYGQIQMWFLYEALNDLLHLIFSERVCILNVLLDQEYFQQHTFPLSFGRNQN